MCARTVRIAIVIQIAAIWSGIQTAYDTSRPCHLEPFRWSARDSDSTPADPTIDAASGHGLPMRLASAGGQGRLVGVALVAGLLAGVAAWLVGATILGSLGTPSLPRWRTPTRPAENWPCGHVAALGWDRRVEPGDGGLAQRRPDQGGDCGMRGRVDRRALDRCWSCYLSRDHVPPIRTTLVTCTTDPPPAPICSSVGAAGACRDRYWRAWSLDEIFAGRRSRGSPGGGRLRIVGIAFPADKTELPISQTHATRAMFHVLVAALAAVGSALGLSLSSKKRNAGPPQS